MAPLDILIVGSGVAGPALATFLLMAPTSAEEKPRITIVERAASMRSEGQNVDIRGAGATLIRKLGLKQKILDAHTGEEGSSLVDENNYAWCTIMADKTGQVQTGTSDLEILRGRLAEIMYNRSMEESDKVKNKGGSGIEYIFGDTIDELNQDEKKVYVRFKKSGQKRTFDLVVGADGLLSETRKLAFGAEQDEARIKYLGMYGAFFKYPSNELDSDLQRWYHAPGRRGIMMRPSGVKGISTAFMHVIDDNGGRLKEVAAGGRSNMAAQKDLLAEIFSDAGGESTRMIDGMYKADDFYYCPVAQVRMDKWSKGRVVLVGDAGYAPSPITGMGTTLGLTGAYNLAGALVQNPNDLPSAFAQYEARARPNVEKAQNLPPGVPHLFNPATAWGVYVFHVISGFISWSGLGLLMFRLLGPKANSVPVEDYGLVFE